MAKLPTNKAPPSRQIVHEAGAHFRHRLVIIGDGMNAASPWYEGHEVGLFKGYHFSTGTVTNIPVGVFRTSEVSSQVLG